MIAATQSQYGVAAGSWVWMKPFGVGVDAALNNRNGDIEEYCIAVDERRHRGSVQPPIRAIDDIVHLLMCDAQRMTGDSRRQYIQWK